MGFYLPSGIFTLAEDPDSLAFTPWEGLREHQLDRYGQVEGVVERLRGAILECCVAGGFLRDVLILAQVVNHLNGRSRFSARLSLYPLL